MEVLISGSAKKPSKHTEIMKECTAIPPGGRMWHVIMLRELLKSEQRTELLQHHFSSLSAHLKYEKGYLEDRTAWVNLF